MTNADDQTVKVQPIPAPHTDEAGEVTASVDVLLDGAVLSPGGATVTQDSSWSHTCTIIDPGADHVALPNGHQLGEFTILALLGTGGFGLTYLARDNHLECEVAIKEYLPHELAIRLEGYTVCPRSQDWVADYQGGLKRFLAEARTLASFRHPNIVRITRFFEANGTAYMVMDYERGKSLREWRRTRVAVTSEDDLLRMFLPLLDGLEVVHQGKVMHRDIKPANIYVRETDGSLVLLDFGSARQTQLVGSQGVTTIVTPGYAPFEQYHSRGVQGPWSDIYALGAVLYWLITGEKPLEAPARLKDDSMVPLRERARDRFSQHFLAAIDWALQSDEKLRPTNIADFRAALTGQMEVPALTSALVPAANTPLVIEGTARGERKPRPFLWIGLAAGLLLAGGMAGWHFLAKQPPEVQPAQVAKVEPVLVPAPAATPVPAPVPVAEAPAAPHATVAVPPAPAPAVERLTEKPQPIKPEAAKPKKQPPALEKPAAKDASAPAQPGPSAPLAHALTAKLALRIVPYGEVYLDGKRVGKSPPLLDLPISPGKHKLEVRGDSMPYVAYYNLDLKAGESKQISLKFGND